MSSVSIGNLLGTVHCADYVWRSAAAVAAAAVATATAATAVVATAAVSYDSSREHAT